MKPRLVTAIALLAGLLAVCGPVFAHHGNAAYDMTKVVTLKNAKVTKVLWANPHVLIFFDVTDKDGKVAHWVAEAGSPSADFPQGWTSGTLQPGDMLTARLFQAKSGRTIGRMGTLTLANGRVLSAFGGLKNPLGVGTRVTNCNQKSVEGGSGSLACVGKAKQGSSK